MATTTTVPCKCRCGRVRGTALDVSPDTGNRIFCYCDDCQAFAAYLDRPDVLDAAGGTDIFQLAPSRLRITEGASEVRCVRLSEKGMHRWYTECCRSPIGNTLDARVPFVGVIHTFMDHGGDGRSRDEVLGKPIGYCLGRFAIGGTPPHAHPKMPLGLLLRAARMLGTWLLKGLGKPSPFFDAATGAPCATPRILSRDERDALRRPNAVAATS